MTNIMIHRTAGDRVDAILGEGLRVNMPVNLTDCGTWAHDWYGANPVFLASPDARFLEALEGEGIPIEVDVAGLQLVADLPSLCDIGGMVDEGWIWWREGREPPDLLPYLDENGGIEIEYLLDPGTDACGAAIRATGTAACLESIPPARLRVMAPAPSP